MPKVTLKAPFPAFGGKSRIADLVWRRLGNVDNYIEPFAFSAACLLRRPLDGNERPVETINDLNAYVANFWRAVQADPDAVAKHADWPVNEADLHARHNYLVNGDTPKWNAAKFRKKARANPDYYDAKVAGWWCWGQCCWIGSGWCEHPEWEGRGSAMTNPNGFGRGVNAGPSGPVAKRPSIGQRTGRGAASTPKRLRSARPDIGGKDGGSGRGVTQQSGGRPQLGDAYDIGRGVCGNGHAGSCKARREWLTQWMHDLADRLRLVRVCCGDWKRVCDSATTTTRLGMTGVFLDPPYPSKKNNGDSSRDGKIYATDGTAADLDKLRDEVLEWCQRNGKHRKMRVAVCGYEGDGYEALEAEGWQVVAWKAQGGYGNRSAAGKANAKRERVWFSPACVPEPRNLFN